jgi:tetratricopeptide (TPR) repeat protein
LNSELLYGLQLQELGKYKEALKIYQTHLSLNPTKNELIFIYGNSANIYFILKDYDKALTLYNKALEINKNNQQIIFNLGVLYLTIEEFELSKQYLENSKKINPTHYPTNLNLAICYKNLKLYNQSFDEYSSILANNSQDLDLFYNIGNLYLSVEKYNFAIKNYFILLKKDNKNHKALYSIGLCYHKMMRNKLAIRYFNLALEYAPNYSDCLFAKSLALLQMGDFINGWELYHNRFEAKNPLKKLSYNVDYFTGQDLSNKVILVQGEQGFGDNIQFCRYLIYLQNAKKIYFAVRKPLEQIMKQSFDKLIVCGDKEILEDVDYMVSLLDLPRIFKFENIFFDTKFPYLQTNKNITIANNLQRKKIGFCWEGNSEHKNNHNRSIPLKYFVDLINNNPNIMFFSLQKDHSEQLPKMTNLIDLSPTMDDFLSTASIIKELDLIISIDSALAHLSGAMNKKTYLLLPKYSEWRWLEKRISSPWYPSITMIRQKTKGNWMDVFDALQRNIEND